MSDIRQEAAALIGALTRHVADFPIPGVDFGDLTPVLADARGLAVVTDALAEVADGVDLIAGVDARGFLLGAAVALKMRHRSAARSARVAELPPPVHAVQYDAGVRFGDAGDPRPTVSIWPAAAFW